MAFQDGLAEDFVEGHISDPFSGRIAVDNPVLVINEENALLHGSEDGLKNGLLHFLLSYLTQKCNMDSKIGQEEGESSGLMKRWNRSC
jgi:hypothetical protein